jgi:hypothetical protein
MKSAARGQTPGSFGMGYLRKRTIWDRLFGRRHYSRITTREAQQQFNRYWSQRLDHDMRDEGDLFDQNPPRLTWRMIVGCLAGAAVIYALLTAVLVLTNGR